MPAGEQPTFPIEASRTTSDSTSGVDRDRAVGWLSGRINYERVAVVPYGERQLKLDRMRTLLVRLGQPDAGQKIIHVAGTKGKGSTSAMIAAMLTAAGLRTGVFSSPHLACVEERFAVDGQRATADELVALVDRLRPIAEAMDAEAAGEGDPLGGPTYFEITTVMALLHFVEQQADATVLEVGLGGRLDSTNVCLPVVSVITSIDFDHTRQLGNTLAAIAGEKAGIIKPGVPVVSGVTQPEAQQVIARVAHEHGCRLIQLNRDFRYRYHPPAAALGSIDFEYTLHGQEHALRNVQLAMRGPHQAANAAVALAVVAELRHQSWCVSTDAMRAGLGRAALAARVEFLPGEPAVVIDTAHNEASARALVAAIAELPRRGRRTLILSASSDKDVPAILRALVPHFDRIIVTQYRENARAVPVADLDNHVRTLIDQHSKDSSVASRVELTAVPTPHEAWDIVRRTAEPGELVTIAGSFFLAAEMRPFALAQQSAAKS